MSEGTVVLIIGALFAVAIIACGLWGLIRGARKSIYCLIIFLVMVLVFWLISGPIANALLSAKVDFSSILSDSALASSETVKDLIKNLILENAGEEVGNNEHLLAIAYGLSKAIVKFVVFELLMIVGYLIVSIISQIVWLIFFRGNREKRMARKPYRLVGGLIGGVRGVIVFLIFLIPFGGFVKIVNDSSDIYNEINAPESEEVLNERIFNVSQSDESGALDVVYDYTGAIMENGLTGTLIKMTLPFFDLLYSVDIVDGDKKTSISIKQEADNVFEICSVLIDMGVFDDDFLEESNEPVNTEYRSVSMFYGLQEKKVASESNTSLDDILNVLEKLDTEDVEKIIGLIGNSKLLVTAIPVGIDVAFSMEDVQEQIGTLEDLGIDIDSVYEIDWKSDFTNLGKSVASLIDIVVASDADVYNLLSSDGVAFEELFTSLSKIECLTTLMPAVAKLGDEVLRDALDDDTLSLPNGDKEYWAKEIANIGSVYKAFHELVGDFPTKEVDGEKEPALGVLINKMGSDDTKLDSFSKSIVASSFFLDLMPIAFDIVMEEAGDEEIISSLNEAFELDSMTKDMWEADIEALVHIGKGLIDSGVAGVIKDESSSEDMLSQINFVKLKPVLGNLITLNIIGDNQQAIIDSLLGDALEDEIGSVQIDYSGLITKEDWKNETDSLCDILNVVSTSDDMVLAILKSDPDIILGSKIISNVMVSMLSDQDGELSDTIVCDIPSDSDAWYDTDTEDGELRKILVAMNILCGDATEFEAVFDDILNTIGSLSNEEIDEVFDSRIIYLTSSDMIIDTVGTSITVPNSVKDEKGNITQSEIKSLLKSVVTLDIIDNGDIDVDLGVISDIYHEKTVTYATDATGYDNYLKSILGSIIFHDMLTSTISDSIYVPSSSLITEATLEGLTAEHIGYLKKSEFDYLVVAINRLSLLEERNGSTTIKTVDLGIINEFSTDEELFDDVFASDIVHYKISNTVLEEESDGTLIIPASVVVSIPRGSTTEKYITKVELENLINAVNELALVSSTGTLENVNASVISKIDKDNDDIILASEIFVAKISQVLRAQETTGVISLTRVPSNNATTNKGTTVIVYDKLELKNFFISVNTLGVVSSSGSISVSIGIVEEIYEKKATLTPTAYDSYIIDILNSVIIHDKISSVVMDEESITVPQAAVYGSSLGVPDLGNAINRNGLLTVNEFKGLVASVNELGLIKTVGTQKVIGDVSLNIISTLTNDRIDVMCSSYIFHYAFSDAVLASDGDTINVPHSVITTISTEDYLTINEIKNLCATINEYELIDNTDSSNPVFKAIDASIFGSLETDADVENAIASKIIHFKVSQIILDSFGETVHNSVKEETQVTIAGATVTRNMVTSSEVVALIKSANTLGVVNGSEINVSIGILESIYDDNHPVTGTADPEYYNNVCGSLIMHTKITETVNETDVLVVPADALIEDVEVTNPRYHLLLVSELEALVNATHELGVIGDDGSGNAVMNNVSTDTFKDLTSTQLDVVLESRIMHEKISTTLKSKSSDGLIIPSSACDTTTNRVKKEEVKGLVEAVKYLGIGFGSITIDQLANSYTTDTTPGHEVFRARLEASTILRATAYTPLDEFVSTIEVIRPDIRSEFDSNTADGIVPTDIICSILDVYVAI